MSQTHFKYYKIYNNAFNIVHMYFNIVTYILIILDTM